MKNKKNKNTENILTLIGEGSEIEGNVFSASSARIEGVLKGTVKVNDALIVGASGEVVGDINASHVIIFGKVEGKVEAGVLELKANGNINGDIAIESMIFEQGGKFNGNCKMKETALFSDEGNVTNLIDKGS